MAKNSYPLAYDRHGRRFRPPANAHAWRVRRVKRRWDGYEIVTVRNQWLRQWVPLCLHLAATLDDLSKATNQLAGTYRLDLVDKTAHVLAWTPAFAIVKSSNNLQSADPASSRYQIATFPSASTTRRRR